jgi:hypothetical protein
MKKKISNSQELNHYYNLVNTKLKKYSEMDISPESIAKYLAPGTQNFNNFISEDDDLKDVDGIEVVLKDIIQDTYAAFKDGLFKKIQKGYVKKFENYAINENIFNFETNEEDVKHHQKALADIYKTSLSYIDIIRKDIHLYYVNDEGIIRNVMVFTQEELDKVKENILKELVNSTKNKYYLFNDIHAIGFEINKKIKIEDILNYDKLKGLLNKEITEDDVVETIAANYGGLNLEVKSHKKTNLNSKNYYLFEVDA